MNLSERIQQTDLFDSPQAAASEENLPEVPVRFQPRTSTDQEAQKRNEKYGFTRARKYYPPEEAIEMASTAKSAPIDDRIKSWVNHPDERVALAMLENPQRPFQVKAQARLIGEVLLERALRSAEENDEIWNPLFDQLCIARGSGRRDWWSRMQYGWHDQEYEIQDLKVRSQLPHRNTWMANVEDWLKQARPEEAIQLLNFQATDLREAVAEYTYHMNEELMDRLLEKNGGKMAPYLVKNTGLDDPMQKRLFRRLTEALRKRKDNPPINLDDLDEERRYLYGYDSTPRYLGQALRQLIQKGRTRARLPDDWKQQLIALSQPPEWFYRLRKQKAKKQGARNSPWMKAAEALLQQDLESAITADDLLALYPGVADNSWKTRRLIKHPRANMKVWREVATDSSFFKVREWLSQQAKARKDPVIRDVLSSSTSPDVMLKLLKEAQGDDFRYLFRRVGKEKPKAALRIVHDRGDKRLQLLNRHDLLPMLQSQDQQVRQQAMLALKNMKDSPQQEADEPTARGQQR